MRTRNAALLFLALTLLLTWPLAVHPASKTLPLGPDGDLFIRTLAWDAHAFVRQPLSMFNANIYHPLQHTLAFSENLIGSAFIAAPVQWLTGNTVLAPNIVALVSCMLGGLGVSYIVVHTELYPPGEWGRVEARIDGFGDRLRLVRVADAGRVYSLRRPAPQ